MIGAGFLHEKGGMQRVVSSVTIEKDHVSVLLGVCHVVVSDVVHSPPPGLFVIVVDVCEVASFFATSVKTHESSARGRRSYVHTSVPADGGYNIGKGLLWSM